MQPAPFLALTLALAVGVSCADMPNPQNQTIPETWDKCIGAGIAEIWKNNLADAKPLQIDMACSVPPKPCILAVCNSDAGVKDKLEAYVRAQCKPEDVEGQIRNIETNCWQFADHSAIAAGYRAAIAPAATFGVASALALVMSIL